MGVTILTDVAATESIDQCEEGLSITDYADYIDCTDDLKKIMLIGEIARLPFIKNSGIL